MYRADVELVCQALELALAGGLCCDRLVTELKWLEAEMEEFMKEGADEVVKEQTS